MFLEGTFLPDMREPGALDYTASLAEFVRENEVSGTGIACPRL